MVDHAPMTRRAMLRRTTLAAAGASLVPFGPTFGSHTGPVVAYAQGAATMSTRPIPSSGEALPVVGVGTYLNFDVTPGSEPYRAVIPGTGKRKGRACPADRLQLEVMNAADRRGSGTSRVVGLHDDDGAFDRKFWADVPPSARLEALWDLTLELQALQGHRGDQSRLQRSVCRVERRGR